MYQENTPNSFDICLFGFAKSLVFRHKNLNRNMVLNRVEAKVLQRRQTVASISNFGVNMVIGLLSKDKNFT
jgi:hypothetical protein